MGALLVLLSFSNLEAKRLPGLVVPEQLAVPSKDSSCSGNQQEEDQTSWRRKRGKITGHMIATD